MPAPRGDTVYVMDSGHKDLQGVEYSAGTEYVPFSQGVDNSLKGNPTVQTVLIDSVKTRFISDRSY